MSRPIRRELWLRFRQDCPMTASDFIGRPLCVGNGLVFGEVVQARRNNGCVEIRVEFKDAVLVERMVVA